MVGMLNAWLKYACAPARCASLPGPVGSIEVVICLVAGQIY